MVARAAMGGAVARGAGLQHGGKGRPAFGVLRVDEGRLLQLTAFWTARWKTPTLLRRVSFCSMRLSPVQRSRCSRVMLFVGVRKRASMAAELFTPAFTPQGKYSVNPLVATAAQKPLDT
jgi:hypothetical protein